MTSWFSFFYPFIGFISLISGMIPNPSITVLRFYSTVELAYLNISPSKPPNPILTWLWKALCTLKRFTKRWSVAYLLLNICLPSVSKWLSSMILSSSPSAFLPSLLEEDPWESFTTSWLSLLISIRYFDESTPITTVICMRYIRINFCMSSSFIILLLAFLNLLRLLNLNKLLRKFAGSNLF